jgi:uncharacterized membrane protein
MSKELSVQEQQVNEGKIFAMLAYLSLLCIIPLVLKKENPFVLKHGKQGLILFLGEVAVFIVHIVLGQWVLKLGVVAFGVLSFLGIIAALRGREVELPIVSQMAEAITL